MQKQQLINKLRELGIDTDNCYPKKSFISDFVPVVGMYENEFTEDFYFHSDYQNKIYKLPKLSTEVLDTLQKDVFQGKTKRLVPLSMCEIVWEDKPYEEPLDVPFEKMTLRQYTCIHRGVPKSGLPWLDAIIKESHDISREINGN